MNSRDQSARVAFAGDRDISVRVLEFILERNVKPLALFLPSADRATHADELASLCSYLDNDVILRGTDFREQRGVSLIQSLRLDYIICVHFPYLIPAEVLHLPAVGVLNLHPALLPYNRGWHTPTWAILEGTPYGATLHFMDEEIDSGDIIHQQRIAVLPNDTAQSLYRRVKSLEFEVFKEAWPSLITKRPPRTAQESSIATVHKRNELFTSEVQQIDLTQKVQAGDLIDRLRALTTSRLEEAAYFVVDGKRYRVQVALTPDQAED